MALSHFKLEELAAEVLCNIFTFLDLHSALNLAKSSLRLAQIFKSNWAAILLPILERDFSPLNALLHIPHAIRRGCPSEGALFKNRVYFNGRTISEGDSVHLLQPINYRQEHVKSLLPICKIVMGWQAVFPRLRFSQRTQFARSLHDDENERLRRSLYTWWLFAIIFHQDIQEFNLWNSRRSDPRCDKLRAFSTAQLYELQDLWETVRSAIATDLCPSTALVLKNAGKTLSKIEAARLGWGHPFENDLIVSTVMRLLPDHMLHVIESRHVYATRKSLAMAIRFLHPAIERGVESLSDSLRCVINERRFLLRLEAGPRALKRRRYFPPQSFPKPQGGILDYQAQRWQKLRDKYGNDGGKGLGVEVRGFVPNSLRHMPRGLLEPTQQSWHEG